MFEPEFWTFVIKTLGTSQFLGLKWTSTMFRIYFFLFQVFIICKLIILVLLPSYVIYAAYNMHSGHLSFKLWNELVPYTEYNFAVLADFFDIIASLIAYWKDIWKLKWTWVMLRVYFWTWNFINFSGLLKIALEVDEFCGSQVRK